MKVSSTGAARRRGDAPMQAGVLPTSHAMAQLRALEPIKTPYALHVHQPSIPARQHTDATIASILFKRDAAERQIARRSRVAGEHGGGILMKFDFQEPCPPRTGSIAKSGDASLFARSLSPSGLSDRG
jgi:hypothetical protein